VPYCLPLLHLVFARETAGMKKGYLREQSSLQQAY